MCKNSQEPVKSVSSSNIVQSRVEQMDGIGPQVGTGHEKVQISNYPTVFDVKNGSNCFQNDVTGDNMIQVADMDTDDRRRTAQRVINKQQG